jgi:CHAT domain-containing protein/predicted negative regulator of RcsB-dependent stress response
MRYYTRFIALIAFCIFNSFQKSPQNKHELHALIAQRLKEAGTRNAPLLEKTLQEVLPYFTIETDTLGQLYHSLAAAHFNLRNEFKSIEYYEKAYKIRSKLLSPTDFNLSKTLQGYGRTLARVRRAEEALPLLEENLKIRQSTFSPNSDTIAEAMMMLGSVHDDLGNFDKSYSFLNNAIKIYAGNKRDTYRLAYAYQYLGAARFHAKNYVQAKDDFTQAINYMSKINDIRGISECNHNIGEVLMAYKQYAQALPYFEKAQKAYPHSEYLNQMAYSYAQLKQYSKAHQYTTQALDFAHKNTNLCYLYIPHIYVTLGDIYMGEKKPMEALTAYNQSLQLFLNDSVLIKRDPLSIVPPLGAGGLKSGSCRPDLLKVLRKKNEAFAYLFDKTKDKQYLTLALDNYRQCESLVRDMLHSFSEENSRFFWTENVKDIYEKGIQTALALGDNEAALTFAESSRAFNLLSAVQTNKAKRFGGVPDTLLAHERALKTTIAFWQKVSLDPALDSSRIAQSRDGLLTAKQDFEDFQKRLEKQYPKYFDLKYQKSTPLSISALQKTIEEDRAIVEYFISDSLMHTFVITKQNFETFSTKINTVFFQNIADLRKATGDYAFIKNKPDSAQILYLKSARVLYKSLLETPLSIFKVKNEKKRLTIIPDGALAYIPFDLLLTDETKSWRDIETPFLLKKMAVSYAYSLRLLNEQSNIPPSVSGDFGGFGISYDAQKFFFSEKEKQNEKITPLKYTIEEVAAIKSKLGGTAWLDETATKQNFNDNAPKCDMLHLAMHGFLDPNDPLSSGLIFSRTKAGDSTNYLTGYDLYAAQLKAKLAVLSACNTGDGQLRGREGVMSLARSFAFAGCESLIMSLWSVPDKTTSEIMVQFYGNLKQGMPKDIALQQAKIIHLENAEPSRRVPNNWAAMVVIGNIEPLVWQAWWQSWWVLLGGVLVIVLALFIIKNRK